MQVSSLLTFAVLSLAQLAVSAPAPAPTDIGVCIHYTESAADAVASYVATGTGHSRVADCVAKYGNTDAAVTCVKGFVGGCPSYEWI